MASPFHERLQAYFSDVSTALRSQSAAASIFPNTTDIGTSRERVYVELLRTCLPSACNVNLGGFLFDANGNESKQIDVIVTTDTCPQFNFHNRDGQGKTFSCIDGTLAVASLKSNLNRATLFEALDNLASLPQKQALQAGMVSPLISIPDYADWPYKIIYAPDGVELDTLESALFEYIASKPTRVYGSPNTIHVAGRYSITRTGPEERTLADGTCVKPFTWVSEVDSTDAGPLSRVMVDIHTNLVASRHIVWDYRQIVGGFKIPVPEISYVVIETTECYPEVSEAGQPPSGQLEAGMKVKIVEKYGEYCLVETGDGQRVQIPLGKLKQR